MGPQTQDEHTVGWAADEEGRVANGQEPRKGPASHLGAETACLEKKLCILPSDAGQHPAMNSMPGGGPQTGHSQAYHRKVLLESQADGEIINSHQ